MAKLDSNTHLYLMVNLNKISISIKNYGELYNPGIESKYIKIIRYKKITLNTHKLQKIYANL